MGEVRDKGKKKGGERDRSVAGEEIGIYIWGKGNTIMGEAKRRNDI